MFAHVGAQSGIPVTVPHVQSNKLNAHSLKSEKHAALVKTMAMATSGGGGGNGVGLDGGGGGGVNRNHVWSGSAPTEACDQVNRGQSVSKATVACEGADGIVTVGNTIRWGATGITNAGVEDRINTLVHIWKRVMHKRVKQAVIHCPAFKITNWAERKS